MIAILRFAAFVIVVASASAGAQSLPRTEFDGRPDLSGVWENVPPPGPAQALTLNDVPFATFADIGAGYHIGLPLQAWAALLKRTRMAAKAIDADVRCRAGGVQHLNAHPSPRRIVHAPGVIAITYDPQHGRQIFTDARPRRNPDTQLFSYGYSRGAWQGDTLVVLTTHYLDGWLDLNGSPVTPAGRTVERFRLVDGETLEIQQTVDDLKAYQRPFTTRLTWRRTESPLPPPCR